MMLEAPPERRFPSLREALLASSSRSFRPGSGRAVRGTYQRLRWKPRGEEEALNGSATLTAQTRQKILRVYWLGQNLEFVSLGTRPVQKIRGSSLA
jgi:hypothetical protein